VAIANTLLIADDQADEPTERADSAIAPKGSGEVSRSVIAMATVECAVPPFRLASLVAVVRIRCAIARTLIGRGLPRWREELQGYVVWVSEGQARPIRRVDDTAVGDPK
jgi:hypothetical protein